MKAKPPHPCLGLLCCNSSLHSLAALLLPPRRLGSPGPQVLSWCGYCQHLLSLLCVPVWTVNYMVTLMVRWLNYQEILSSLELICFSICCPAPRLPQRIRALCSCCTGLTGGGTGHSPAKGRG